MKEAIEIYNFGPIREMKISDIKTFVVLIGRSATGKSTLMKIVALFRYIFKLANIRSYYHLSKIRRSPFRIDFAALLRENGLAGMVEQSTRVVYSATSESGAVYTVEYSEKKLQKLPDVAAEDLLFLKGAFVSENRNAISSWLGNGLERRGIKMGFYFDETLDLFLKATDSIKELALPYIGVNFSAHKTSNGVWQYSLHSERRPEKKSIRLREASSGMKSTVPLALIVNYMAHSFNFKDAYRRSIIDYLLKSDRLTDFKPVSELEGFQPVVAVHIEEPELSLDPASQVSLQECIVNTLFHSGIEDRRCMLMYATHSPYLANHVNLLMAQYEHDPQSGLNPEDVEVYLTDEDGGIRSVMVTDEQGRRIVDSEFLAKEIEDIYSLYSELRPS